MRVDLGAVPSGPTTTQFTVWAPDAAAVELHGSSGRVCLTRGGDGYHRGSAPWGPGSLYHFVLDGGTPLADPASRALPDGVHGPSEVVDLT